MLSSGAIAGDFVYIDVKFCADFESAAISEIRWLVFALLRKESASAIISRQEERLLAVFRHKTEALRKSRDIEQDRTAPRERAHQNTSRGAGPELVNARRHGFAGTKIGENGHFGPILADFGHFWRH